MALFGKQVKRARNNPGYTLSLVLDYGRSNYIFDLPFANILSFTNKRVGIEGNQFTLNLIGDLSIDIEYKLLTGNRKISITYGWLDGDKRTFVGEILDTDIKIEDMTIVYSISGVVSVVSADRTTRSCNWVKGTSFSKIIDLITSAHNWEKGFIVDANPLPKDVLQTNVSDEEFLSETLSKILTTKDRGISDYVLWFTYDGARTIMNYAPVSYGDPSSAKRSYVLDLFGSANSTMLSYEAEQVGHIAYAIGSELYAASVNGDTGAIELKTSDVAKEAMNKLQEESGYLYGLRQHYSNNNDSSIQSNLSDDSGQLVNYYWQKMFMSSVVAKATIIGDVTLDVNNTIQIIIVLQNGKVYYLSGMYNITGVEDTIDSGGFETKLDLVKVVGSVL